MFSKDGKTNIVARIGASSPSIFISHSAASDADVEKILHKGTCHIGSYDLIAVMIWPALETPFDLSSGPLVRFVHIQNEATDLLQIIAHRIVADDWSMDVIAGDLEALLSGSSLPPLPLQYTLPVMRSSSEVRRGNVCQICGLRRLCRAPICADERSERRGYHCRSARSR